MCYLLSLWNYLWSFLAISEWKLFLHFFSVLPSDAINITLLYKGKGRCSVRIFQTELQKSSDVKLPIYCQSKQPCVGLWFSLMLMVMVGCFVNVLRCVPSASALEGNMGQWYQSATAQLCRISTELQLIAVFICIYACKLTQSLYCKNFSRELLVTGLNTTKSVIKNNRWFCEHQLALKK